MLTNPELDFVGNSFQMKPSNIWIVRIINLQTLYKISVRLQARGPRLTVIVKYYLAKL